MKNITISGTILCDVKNVLDECPLDLARYFKPARNDYVLVNLAVDDIYAIAVAPFSNGQPCALSVTAKDQQRAEDILQKVQDRLGMEKIGICEEALVTRYMEGLLKSALSCAGKSN